MTGPGRNPGTTMDAWLSATDLAAIYRVAIGTIYARASRDRWRRTMTWPRRYAMADAQATYDKLTRPTGLLISP